MYYLYIQMYGTTALGVGLLFDASDWRYWVLPVCSIDVYKRQPQSTDARPDAG